MSVDLGDAIMSNTGFFDSQSLRLLTAFFKVRDNDARALLIHLAESAERGLSIGGTVDGLVAEIDGHDGKVVSLPTPKKPFK
jgi:hypothetical protein